MIAYIYISDDSITVQLYLVEKTTDDGNEQPTVFVHNKLTQYVQNTMTQQDTL